MPIVDSVVDLRFEPSVPDDAVFGVAFSAIRGEYRDPEPSPHLQLPKEVRDREPEFRFKPHYRLHNPPFILQVGPRVVVVSTISYPGWDKYSSEVQRVLSAIIGQGVTGRIYRLGLRYINFFELNVFEYINLGINVLGRQVVEESSFLRTAILNDQFVTTLQVTNGATIERDGNQVAGSVIDLDTFVEFSDPVSASDIDILDLLARAHEITQAVFFPLLGDKFLATLNPVYE